MQPWPGEILEERAGEIAVGFAALLTRQAAWRHRRVETITVLSHEQVRRAVSIDFTVAAEHRDDVKLAGGQWIVPLALLAKRPLAHFDLRAEDLASVPLLRAEETQVIARELLYVLLDLDLSEADAGEVDADALIERAVAIEPADLGRELAALDEAAGPLPVFAGFADRLSRGFLLCAVLDDVSRRRVIKYAYDEPLPRPGLLHFYDAPGCTEAASYHVEVAVPEEMRARSTELVDNVTGTVLASGPRDADRPGVYYVATGAQIEPGLSVRYGTERGRFLAPAALVAWLIALELALPWLFADLARLAEQAGPAIAILLSSSAVFSGLVLRGGEHPLVRLVLAPYRLCLAGATVAAVLAGSTLAFQASSGVLGWCWGLGALAAVLAAGILSTEAARAPSSQTAWKDR